jgi:hypothetical protein
VNALLEIVKTKSAVGAFANCASPVVLSVVPLAAARNALYAGVGM